MNNGMSFLSMAMARIKMDSLDSLFGSGIYFLYKNSDIVYIGQSGSSILNRIASHTKDKDFDSFSCIPLSDEELVCRWHDADANWRIPDLIDIESALIRKLKPKYNWFIRNYMPAPGGVFGGYPDLYCRKNKTGIPDNVLIDHTGTMALAALCNNKIKGHRNEGTR